MQMDIKSLETELLKLTPREKAIITYKLLESLDAEENHDYENIWIDEALKRYDQLSGNKKLLIDCDLVIKEAKSKYN